MKAEPGWQDDPGRGGSKRVRSEPTERQTDRDWQRLRGQQGFLGTSARGVDIFSSTSFPSGMGLPTLPIQPSSEHPTLASP